MDDFVVEVVADEDGNNEAGAEGPEPVAQGNIEVHIPHGHDCTDLLLEVVAGEVYGIEEEGYAVVHWSMPNTDEVGGYAVEHRKVPTRGEVEGEAVDYIAAAVAVSGEVAVGM